MVWTDMNSLVGCQGDKKSLNACSVLHISRSTFLLSTLTYATAFCCVYFAVPSIKMVLLSYKIFEPLGFTSRIQQLSSKTQIHSIQRWCHFGAQTSQSAFLLEKRLHPFLHWIKYSWSGSTHILYYINLSVRWNTALRNQISSCQHVFYYTTAVALSNVGHILCSFLLKTKRVSLLGAGSKRWKTAAGAVKLCIWFWLTGGLT
jgi:hypothetical protein